LKRQRSLSVEPNVRRRKLSKELNLDIGRVCVACLDMHRRGSADILDPDIGERLVGIGKERGQAR